MAKLQRTTFKSSRAAQYIEARALQAMTGQPVGQFAAVVLKELLDNSLDALEAAHDSDHAPEVVVGIKERPSQRAVEITVKDNASGIPPETVHGALDFNVLVSDKSSYRSPTRGAQGNALKTIFGIPAALGSLEPVVVEAKGTRHEARVWKDPAGELRVQCDDSEAREPLARPESEGTSVTVVVPHQGTIGSYRGIFEPEYWVRAFALFNPHAKVRIERFDEPVYQVYPGKSPEPYSEDSYLPTRDPHERFKYLPTDPTSPHWYDVESFGRLVYSHMGHHRHEGGDDLRLRDFVRQFKGLSATKKAKAVCDEFPRIKTLSDFERDPTEIRSLLHVMKANCEAPSHNTFGILGKDHFRERFEDYYGDLYRFDYKKMTGTVPWTAIPYLVEFAIAEVESGEAGELFTAVNYSPTFDDPLEDVRFRAEGLSEEGLRSFLVNGFCLPDYGRYDDPTRLRRRWRCTSSRQPPSSSIRARPALRGSQTGRVGISEGRSSPRSSPTSGRASGASRVSVLGSARVRPPPIRR
jgi:Histidine kinase-, DNA gyrase B-, and HSP90-like ATPase